MSGLLDTFRELVLKPGVSGFEHPVRDLIIQELRKLGLEPKVDSMGNVIAEVGEGEYRVLVTAHMDEVGLVVTYVENDGKLRFRKVGGIDDRVLQNQIVEIYLKDRVVSGVVSVQPPHIQLKRDVQIVPWHELYIDIGVDSRQEAEELGIRPPCPAVLKKHITHLGGGKCVAARAVDDRAGCAVLLELCKTIVRERELHRRFHYIFAWTVQEEIGLRGAKALTAVVRPSIVYVLDTVTCCNPVITGDMKLGAGPVLRILDNEFIAPVDLVFRIKELADREGIPCQVCTAGGTTDALELQEMNVPTVPIGIPVKYSHSLVETFNVQDLENWYRLMYMLLTTRLD